MDETKETNQDASQKSSDGRPGTTSKEPAKTYTEEERDKAVNDALATAGRTAKELDDRKAGLDAERQELDDLKGEVTKVQEQIDQAELEAAKGDPERLRELQAKKSYKDLLDKLEAKKKELDKREAELNRSKAEHESEVNAAKQTQLEIELWKIAEAEGIKAEDLKKGMKDLGLTTVEQAKTLAKTLKTGKQPESKKGEKFDPDSGVTSGGGESLEGKSASKLFAEDFRDEQKK